MMKELWSRRPSALLFLVISYCLWTSVTVRWITVFVEQRHPLTWAVSGVLLLFALLMGFEPLLTGRSPLRAHLYLTFQTSLIFAASLLHYELDFFALLYVPICGQAMFLLPRRPGLVWLGILIVMTAVGQFIQFGGLEAISFILLYAAGLAFVAAFTLMVLQADRARQQSDHLLTELQAAHSQLQTQADQAEELAIAKERNRLARDLHDSVAQTLYGLTLQAEAASRQLDGGKLTAVQSKLAEMQESAQQTLLETRLLIYELRPPILERDGLIAALKARLDAVESRSGLIVQQSFPEAINLPAKVETGLYRIAQEALNNVIKHAQADEVKVAVRLGNGRVILQISDDGVGFAPTAGLGGMGLAGMRERAEQIGGTLHLESEPGRGTGIRVEVEI
jgi:signal transduction histidine kinase